MKILRLGTTVPYLPDEADEETISGKKYFVYIRELEEEFQERLETKERRNGREDAK